jgi:hypothetical protein
MTMAKIDSTKARRSQHSKPPVLRLVGDEVCATSSQVLPRRFGTGDG